MIDVKPFCRWAGGKNQLLKHLLPLTPTNIGTYYEPFVGGGAMFFALANVGAFKNAVLCDVNLELFHTWTSLRDDYQNVISTLRGHKIQHGLQFFYDLRMKKWSTLPSHEIAARFLYLNKACFNGLYRVNKKGEFNVPWGDREASAIFDNDSLLACGALIKKYQPVVMCGDFEGSIFTWDGPSRALNPQPKPKPGDLVYFDPPYVPVKKTSHTAYSGSGFGPEDQQRLARAFRRLHEAGVNVIASNADMPFTRELYNGFKMIQIQARRNISQNAEGRVPVGELIILGGPIGD